MRAIILAIATVFLAALGFGIYWEMQGGGVGGSKQSSATRQPPKVAPGPIATTSGATIGPGEKAAWDRYDPQSGELTSSLSAERYEQQKDGRFFVVKPVAKFYMRGSKSEGAKEPQMLVLTGETGTITMQENIGRGRPTPVGGM